MALKTTGDAVHESLHSCVPSVAPNYPLQLHTNSAKALVHITDAYQYKSKSSLIAHF